MRAALLTLGLAGCVPTFDAVGCFGPEDCPATYRCVDRACAPVDAGADAEADAAAPTGPVLRGIGGATAFGRSIVPLGDLDGDGFTDLAIGAPEASAPDCPARCGRLYLYRGGPGAPTLHAIIDGPPVEGAEFGRSVAPAGDLNGDGYADLAVGGERPVVYVFLGGPDGLADGRADRVAAATLGAAPGRARYGLKMGAADLDGDAFDDLVVNGLLYDAHRCDGRLVDTVGTQGALWVYRGSARGLAERPVQLDWPQAEGDVCECNGAGGPPGSGRLCLQAEQWAFAPAVAGETPLIVGAPAAARARGELVTLRVSAPGEVGPRGGGICSGDAVGSGWPGFPGLVPVGDRDDRRAVAGVVRGVPTCADGLPKDEIALFGARPGVPLGSGAVQAQVLAGVAPGERLEGMQPIHRGPRGVFEGLLLRLSRDGRPTYWISDWRDDRLQAARPVEGDDAGWGAAPSQGSAAVWAPHRDHPALFLETREVPDAPDRTWVVRWRALP